MDTEFCTFIYITTLLVAQIMYAPNLRSKTIFSLIASGLTNIILGIAGYIFLYMGICNSFKAANIISIIGVTSFIIGIALKRKGYKAKNNDI